jgi:hypothetical protein
MEIIRHRTDAYREIPHRTVDDPSVNFLALGMLTAFLRHRGTDRVTPGALASRHGAGDKTRMKTLEILREGGYIALLRTQSSRGSWVSRMIVSETAMTPDEVKAHMRALLSRDSVIGVQLLDASWKNVPGVSLRKPGLEAVHAEDQ